MFAHEVLESLQATGVAVAIEDGARIVCRARAGNSAPEVGAFLEPNTGISGQCIHEGVSFVVSDTELDSRVNSEASRLLGIRSLAVAPLHRASQVRGILEVFSDSPGSFDETSVRELEAHAVRAAAIWAPERLRQVKREPLPSSDAIIEANAISATTTNEISRSAIPKLEAIDLRPAAEEQFPFPEARSALNGKTSSRWKWTSLVAVVPLVLIGFSYRTPALTFLVRAMENSQLSRTPPPSKAEASPASSGNAASSAVPEQPATNSTSPGPSSLSPTAASANDVAVDNPPPPAKTMIERARSGDGDAQLTLADQYAHGEGADGAEKNLVSAGSWYIVAGIAGNSQGKQRATELTRELSPRQIAQIRFRVGEMLRDGIGVPPDLGAAYSWFVLARAAGDARAEREEKKLAEVMKPREIADARTHAANWIATRK